MRRCKKNKQFDSHMSDISVRLLVFMSMFLFLAFIKNRSVSRFQYVYAYRSLVFSAIFTSSDVFCVDISHTDLWIGGFVYIYYIVCKHVSDFAFGILQ